VGYSKGQMEDEITKALIQWEKEYKGRGPTEARTDILRDMVIVILRGVLSQAEQQLSRNLEGMALVKELRRQLVEQGRPELEKIVNQITARQVVSVHTDVSTKTGERVFIFMMDKSIE
jgi:uncharacterized protein YbcI